MNCNVKVYEKKPKDFSAQVEIAAIYVNVFGRILLLQLASHKAEKGAWGVPAGKLEAGENPLQAAQRELCEETGINVELEAFQSLGALYIRKPELDYVYHIFDLHLNATPSISISAEHSVHSWASREEAQALPLMLGAKQALDCYYQKIGKKDGLDHLFGQNSDMREAPPTQIYDKEQC